MDIKTSGKLIVIEGIDGSGKATQSAMLAKWLNENSHKTTKISFPDYANPSSTLVKMYLNGEIGQASDISPYAASTFYAVDRYISYKNNWEMPYLNGEIIVSDRYTTSNIVHQMVLLPQSEWEEYINWLEDYEYIKMGLPKPDLVIYLDMHPKISQKLMEKRYNGDNSKKDILESNYSYMESCRNSALFAAENLNWQIIPCFKEENPLSLDEIQSKIQSTLIKNLKI
ncbi:MAG: deoxynucleoside kinase [Oscillospiraceae bacterium]